MRFPYGVREFDTIINDGYVYIDRTHCIPLMEEWGRELLFIRPRRFGKSLWIATLMDYYNAAKADQFDQGGIPKCANCEIVEKEGK